MDEADENDSTNPLLKTIEMQPQDQQLGVKSEIVVIDNRIRQASIFAKMFVPGVERLLAEVEVTLKQKKPGDTPSVVASLQLEKSDKSPIADLSIGMMQLSLQEFRLGLEWTRAGGRSKWDLRAEADGQVSFTPAAAVIPDLDDLKKPDAIKVLGLDLRKLNLKRLTLPLHLERPATFQILGDLFLCEIGDFELTWEFEGRLPVPRVLVCREANFRPSAPGAYREGRYQSGRVPRGAFVKA